MAWRKRNKDEVPAKDTVEESKSTEAVAASGTSGKPAGSRPVHFGEAVTVDGDVTVTADVNVEGTIDGKLVLTDHVLTVGKLGRVTEGARARVVIVAGEITGDVEAQDRVVIVADGTVRGDIKASKVALSEGARFSGTISRQGSADAKNTETAA